MFDIDSDSGVWFDFQESTIDADGEVTFLPAKEGAGSFCIRQADADFFDALYRKTRKKEVVFKPNPALRNTLQKLEDMVVIPGKEKEEREALVDHWIADYKDLRNAKGELIPVTKENKVKLYKLGTVRRFVDECHRRISSDGGMVKEQIENL